MNVDIAVYADWEGLSEPFHLGWLQANPSGRNELFSFELTKEALSKNIFNTNKLDPRIFNVEGRQFPQNEQKIFGVFSDSSPDRWGRMLMLRRFEREKRSGLVDKKANLRESDFLLGVHDQFRAGALRFKLNNQGDFLDNSDDVAAPPFVRLRELQAASLALESDEDNIDESASDWIRMLIAPGGSLGGARPKASVQDEDGALWIAKFPSVKDEINVGAWETLVQVLARVCGLNAAESKSIKLGQNPHLTYLVKRFDRTQDGKRLHFASAMTLTGHKDGDDASFGASYLEIANVIINQGERVDEDLRELWSRIVFNMLASNTDDHLRNHGFILTPNKGWRLSQAYDMNPDPSSHGLKLNVSENDNALDLDLALSVASIFRVKDSDAKEIVENMKSIVSQWRPLATSMGIPKREQDGMEDAFGLAN